jgi:hypothetical protein
MPKHAISVQDTDAEGSYCTTDSQRHVDNVSGIGAATAMAEAEARGDTVWEIDHSAYTPDSRHDVIPTQADNDGRDTGAPSKHGC